MFLLTILKINHTLGQHALEQQELTELPDLSDKNKYPSFDNCWSVFYSVREIITEQPAKKTTAKK